MKFLKVASVTTALVLSTSANAALIERLGGLAYYDTDADLTWLADANAAGTAMNWDAANTWAASLNVAGIDGWRLASANNMPDASCDPANNDGTFYNCTGTELGHLFYSVLGGSANTSIITSHNANYDLFSNIQGDGNYWSATEDSASRAWDIYMGQGDLGDTSKSTSYYAWAVHSGDVSAVPVPAAVWLFGSGLIGLIGIARRKKA